MKNVGLLFVLLVLAIALPRPGAAQEKDRIIYVADLQDFSGSVSNEVLDLFTEIVRDGARKYATDYRLMDKENAQIILEGFGLDLRDCMKAGRDDCEVKFAERVQADIGVSGQILNLPEGGIRLVLKMYDVNKRSPLNSKIAAADSVAQLEELLPDVVVELFSPLYRPAQAGGVVGGGTVTRGIGIDRGEKIVNRKTDSKGLLFVETKPSNANILVNGKAVGTSPYQASLMVGRYVVIAELNSYYYAARQEIELTTDGATVELELPPAFGEIQVNSTPAGADVMIDDKPVGKTPYRDSRLLSGIHKVEVRQNLYKPAVKSVEIRDGRATVQNFDLQQDFGGIKVTSEPSGAEITLDGRGTGKRTPATFTPVKTGTHVINLDMVGYGRGVETITVMPGKVADVAARLEPKYGTLAVMTQTRNGRPCRGPIFIDGKAVGQTPWKGDLLAVEHQVRVDCGAGPAVERINVEHNRAIERTISVDGPSGDDVQGAGAPEKTDRDLSMDARRRRASFQGRLSGGLDLYRASEGVGGLIQVGVGTGRWFDIHTGVGFPSYSWVTDFEVNLWPYGRFVPTIAARVGLGFHPDHNAYSIDFTAGLEMWMADWAAFFVKIGVGYSWNLTHDVSGIYVPGWAGLEFRY